MWVEYLDIAAWDGRRMSCMFPHWICGRVLGYCCIGYGLAMAEVLWVYAYV
jgi:hypothetical protein